MAYEPEDIEVRRNALALHKAMVEAEKAASGEFCSFPVDALEKMDRLGREYRDACEKLSEQYQQAIDAIKSEFEENPLRRAERDARDAYDAAPGPALNETFDGKAMICAVSGVPIWETDEIIEDPETGEVFLRAALALPPRPEPNDEDEDEDEESGEEYPR